MEHAYGSNHLFDPHKLDIQDSILLRAVSTSPPRSRSLPTAALDIGIEVANMILGSRDQKGSVSFTARPKPATDRVIELVQQAKTNGLPRPLFRWERELPWEPPPDPIEDAEHCCNYDRIPAAPRLLLGERIQMFVRVRPTKNGWRCNDE
jgi:hypothetical protein